MKAIITVIGKDKAGIIAKVSGVLAENKINIEDINQTIVQGNFTMFMLVDFSNAKISLKELHNLMIKVGEEIGVSIHVQHQDIFDVMHNV
jgi:ACT domain-containing protein